MYQEDSSTLTKLTYLTHAAAPHEPFMTYTNETVNEHDEKTIVSSLLLAPGEINRIITQLQFSDDD